MSHEKSKAMKHQHGKSQHVKTSQGFGPPLIIAGQPPKTGYPGKGAFHDPAARQQDKTAFGFGQFDHFQANAAFLRRMRRSITGIPLSASSIFPPGGAFSRRREQALFSDRRRAIVSDDNGMGFGKGIFPDLLPPSATSNLTP